MFVLCDIKKNCHFYYRARSRYRRCVTCFHAISALCVLRLRLTLAIILTIFSTLQEMDKFGSATIISKTDRCFSQS
jgi:hypothetical protein